MYIHKLNKNNQARTDGAPLKEKLSGHMKRHWRKYAMASFVIVLLVGLSFWFLIKPALQLKSSVYAMVDQAREIRKSYTKKDYEGIMDKINSVELTFGNVKSEYAYFDFIKTIPVVNNYYIDGENIIAIVDEGIAMAKDSLDGLEPYKEILGFNIENEELNTEEQLLRIAQISPQLIPLLDSNEKHLIIVEEKLSMIDISRYPESFQGYKIHEMFNQSKSLISEGKELIHNIEPILPYIPTALGSPEPATYLLLFQNDKEIRPTGGFITAYALVEFTNGEFEILLSDNIYDLDAPEGILPTPIPIIQYLKQNSLAIRDVNFSPDYQKSMQDFRTYAAYTNLPSLNGIIALDTHFVEEMIQVTGPIDLPQYTETFTEFPNIPQECKTGGTVFTSENVVCRLELYAQKLLRRTEGDRKRILGDLMKEIVDKTLNLNTSELPKVITSIINELNEKHVLISMEDKELQQFIEQYGWGGRILSTNTTDYLHINDANLAGLKSDMYLKRYVNQEVTVKEDGSLENKLTLTYENPEPQDGWLNAVARNYVRVYVPQGSELISFTGDITRTPEVYDDLGKTVFDNFILIPPLETRTVEIVYKLPNRLEGSEYSVLIQKQPGKDIIPHQLSLNGIKQEFDLITDREIVMRVE